MEDPLLELEEQLYILDLYICLDLQEGQENQSDLGPVDVEIKPKHLARNGMCCCYEMIYFGLYFCIC